MSSTQPLYNFNGILSTDKTVLQNLETLTEACNSFLTFDINTGKWCVVINKTGSSVKSFNNSNIIGAISVSGTGINDLYNKVVVEFPHKDLADQTDAVISTVDPNDLLPNEQANVLNLKYDIINDPIHAELLGVTKLKQSRVDKIIKFRTDFSSLGLKAGDLIDVTSDVYSYTSKVFRIISIEEEDADDGSILLSITGLEYDANVYNNSGLTRTLRTPLNGITQKVSNEAIQENERSASLADILSLLLPLAATTLFNSMFPNITKKFLDAAGKPTFTTSLSNAICSGGTLTGTITYCPGCADYSGIVVPYTITGIDAADTSVALSGNLTLNAAGVATLPIPTNPSAAGKTLTFTSGTQSSSSNVTGGLSFTYQTNASESSITEGQGVTISLTTTGVANGTSVPYTITGSGTSKVTTPLAGNVTVNNNLGVLVVNTSDDAIYTGSRSITVTFNPLQSDPCGQLDKTAAVTIEDNEAPPPSNTNCNPIEVPVFWCPIYEASTGKVIGLEVLQYASFCSPIPGSPTATVPTSVSVAAGSPSIVTITSTATVDAGTTRGGTAFQVQTSFNSIPFNGAVTGSTVTLIGFAS